MSVSLCALKGSIATGNCKPVPLLDLSRKVNLQKAGLASQGPSLSPRAVCVRLHRVCSVMAPSQDKRATKTATCRPRRAQEHEEGMDRASGPRGNQHVGYVRKLHRPPRPLSIGQGRREKPARMPKARKSPHRQAKPHALTCSGDAPSWRCRHRIAHVRHPGAPGSAALPTESTQCTHMLFRKEGVKPRLLQNTPFTDTRSCRLACRHI